MKPLKPLLICFIPFLFSYAAYAADVVDVPLSDLFSQLIQLVSSFFLKDQGSMSWAVKLSAALALALSSMKSSALRPFWDRLGNFKAYAAPLIGIGVGILAPIAAGQPVTLKGIFAFLGAGAGAIALHEIIDTLKAIPGVNKYVLMFISLVEAVLGGKAPVSSAPSQPS